MTRGHRKFFVCGIVCAREGRAVGSPDTKWGRKLQGMGLKLVFGKDATDFSSDLQRGYEVGSDFGGWRKKQEAWEEAEAQKTKKAEL